MMPHKKVLSLARGEIKTVKPFCDLFPIKPGNLEHIVEDMRKNGYDYAHPIILWRGAVVDGHTRLAAAKLARIGDIPVVPRNFKDEDEALEYAIKSQSNRRNLSDSELMNCLSELDKRRKAGRPKLTQRGANYSKLAPCEANYQETASFEAGGGKSAAMTAEALGTSRAKIERLRTIQDHAPEGIKKAVLSGKMSVNKAYGETMRQRRKVMPTVSNTVRLAAISRSIKKGLEKCFVQLLKESPELRLSKEEVEVLDQNLCSIVRERMTILLRKPESVPNATRENAT